MIKHVANLLILSYLSNLGCRGSRQGKFLKVHGKNRRQKSVSRNGNIHAMGYPIQKRFHTQDFKINFFKIKGNF